MLQGKFDIDHSWEWKRLIRTVRAYYPASPQFVQLQFRWRHPKHYKSAYTVPYQCTHLELTSGREKRISCLGPFPLLWLIDTPGSFSIFNWQFQVTEQTSISVQLVRTIISSIKSEEASWHDWEYFRCLSFSFETSLFAKNWVKWVSVMR